MTCNAKNSLIIINKEKDIFHFQCYECKQRVTKNIKHYSKKQWKDFFESRVNQKQWMNFVRSRIEREK